MPKVYLSLGSNKGDRIIWLSKAIQLIDISCGAILKQSAVYETAAWGNTNQPDFLNLVVLIETTLSPLALLAKTQAIENELGRQRTIKWGARTLDIDLLFYDNLIENFPKLTIPHPYLHERRFTLLPLSEIAPNYIHPVFNKTITALLAICPDKLEVIQRHC